MAYTFNVNLRRHEYEYAKYKWYHQSFEPFINKRSVVPEIQGIVYAYCRKYEEKRHDPLTHHFNKYAHSEIQLVVLYLPVFIIEKSCT